MNDPIAYALDRLLSEAGLTEERGSAVFHRVYNTENMSLTVSVLKDDRSTLREVYFYPYRPSMFTVKVWSLQDIEKVRRALQEVSILVSL
jgi:hypothetical protein